MGWGLWVVPPATTGPAPPGTGGGCRDGRPSVPCAAGSAGVKGWMDNCKQLNYSGLMSLHISAKPRSLAVCWPGCICEIKQLSLSLPSQCLYQKRNVGLERWLWLAGLGGKSQEDFPRSCWSRTWAGAPEQRWLRGTQDSPAATLVKTPFVTFAGDIELGAWDTTGAWEISCTWANVSKSSKRRLVARRQITPSPGKSWCPRPGHKLTAPFWVQL